jgi:hypothetical protein
MLRWARWALTWTVVLLVAVAVVYFVTLVHPANCSCQGMYGGDPSKSCPCDLNPAWIIYGIASNPLFWIYPVGLLMFGLILLPGREPEATQPRGPWRARTRGSSMVKFTDDDIGHRFDMVVAQAKGELRVHGKLARIETDTIVVEVDRQAVDGQQVPVTMGAEPAFLISDIGVAQQLD